MSVAAHTPPESPRLDRGSDREPDRLSDPLSSFAFWGHDRPPLGRRPLGGPSGASWFERLRGDRRVGAVALLAVALVAGLVWYRIGVDAADRPVGASTSGSSAKIRRSSTATTRGPRDANAELVVHVAGAVARPGIVRLRAGARVVDAIAAAGGAVPQADLNQLNLAAKVADGQRIAVGLPAQPSSAVGSVGAPTGASTGSAGGQGGSTAGPLNLNTATQAQIEALPGIGPVLGAAILAERDHRGGFRSADELRSVHGIGQKRFEDLRDLVTV